MIRLVFGILVLFAIFRFPTIESRSHHPSAYSGIEFSALNCRKHKAVITDFGGVGDGKTSNTKAFRTALSKLSDLASDGGAQLVVPPGKWLTGSFNLTSHFTLFIQKGATILASQVTHYVLYGLFNFLIIKNNNSNQSNVENLLY